jgi:hypothetical protein
MKRKIILPLVSGAIVIFLSGAAVVNSAGTANWTGSPVDGGPGSGGQCSACHSGGSSTPSLSVTSSPAFGGSGTALTYAPNTTYTVTITPSGSYSRYGMNCEIINSLGTTAGSSVAMFGAFGTTVTNNCQIYTATQTTPYPPCVSHNSNSTTAPFSFKWTAPASGTGYIFADVLGVNNSGSTSGDKVSGVTSLTLTPASAMGIATHQNNEANLTVFPNPATDNVRLTYTLKERGTVSVRLYGLNGDLVADLLNETQEVGLQNANVNLPAGLAKGLYMVKLSVNGEVTTQKLMVR